MELSFTWNSLQAGLSKGKMNTALNKDYLCQTEAKDGHTVFSFPTQIWF
jgi:hypothetical protein